MARGHQLCLPADPNTLGFFATEDLKVHPTRSPRPNGNTNKQEQDKRNNKKEAKQLRVSWARTEASLPWSPGGGWGEDVGRRGSCLLDCPSQPRRHGGPLGLPGRRALPGEEEPLSGLVSTSSRCCSFLGNLLFLVGRIYVGKAGVWTLAEEERVRRGSPPCPASSTLASRCCAGRGTATGLGR